MELNRVINKDCIEAMQELPDNCIDTVITDPPYGLEFMGKEWDKFGGKPVGKGYNGNGGMKRFFKGNKPVYIAGKPFYDFSFNWAVEALRVAKPGAILLCFGGTRTYHRLACAIEDAGWEIRDCIMWIYGSGFPKSLNISKAIDKKSGAKREVVGRKTDPRYKYDFPESSRPHQGKTIHNWTAKDDIDSMANITAPATDAAKLWDGYGTGLKPAYEIIMVAQKKLQYSNELSLLDNLTLSNISNNLGDIVWQLLVNLQSQDISKSQAIASIALSTVSLWNIILGENLKKRSKCITSMESKMIIELRTLSLLLSKNMQEDMDGESQTLQNGIPKSQLHGLEYIAKIVENCLVKEKKNMSDILKVIAQEVAIWKQKEKPQYDILTYAKNVEKDLFTKVVTANIVLLSVITNLNQKIKEKELKEIVSIAEKNLKQYYQDQQNIAMSDVCPKDLSNIKPDYTPILIAMKPVDKNYANNALTWGVAGFNIDGGRIPCEKWTRKGHKSNVGFKLTESKIDYFENHSQGRFPANIILECICKETIEGGINQSGYRKNAAKDYEGGGVTYGKKFKAKRVAGRGYKDNIKIHTDPECPCYILDEQSGNVKSHGGGQSSFGGIFGNKKPAAKTFKSEGGASRFFYCAKSSKSERNAGCEGLEEKEAPQRYGLKDSDGIRAAHKNEPKTNNHPCVKPLRLLEYLCTLTRTPTGGIVLDPFAGSGTTGVACINTGRDFILIEKETEYCKIAECRLNACDCSILANK